MLNKRTCSVLGRQSRDTNRNIKSLVYCQYGQCTGSLTFLSVGSSLERNRSLLDINFMIVVEVQLKCP